MNAPIPLLLLALKGRIEFVRITSPFGAPDAENKEPENVPDKIRAAMREMKKA